MTRRGAPAEQETVAASYRATPRDDADPALETEVAIEIIRRSTTLRRRLLILAIAGSPLGGAAGVVLHLAFAVRVYGRVLGLAFAVGAVLMFMLLRQACRVIARSREAQWIENLRNEHRIDADALADVARMLDG